MLVRICLSAVRAADQHFSCTGYFAHLFASDELLKVTPMYVNDVDVTSFLKINCSKTHKENVQLNMICS